MTTWTLATIVVGDPDLNVAQECPDCGFDALLTFPLTTISTNGVGPAGQYRACARCWEPEQ